MNIAIDIDDTLTLSFAHFQPCVAEFFGASLEEVQRRGISYANLPPEWKVRNPEFCRKYYGAYAPSTPFKPDAKWGVDTLRAMGHRIVILTGRDTTMYLDPYATSREELANGGITYDKLICTTAKGQACREEHIELLIDDLPKNCDMARDNGIQALLFNSPANHDTVTPYRRVCSWADAVKAVQEMEHKQ